MQTGQSVNSENNSMFALWSSGVLTLIAPLDFELAREYYLSVEGSRGKPSLSDIATVIINVTDVNDNAPAFGRGDYSAGISEDLTPGGLVMKVEVEAHVHLSDRKDVCRYTCRNTEFSNGFHRWICTSVLWATLWSPSFGHMRGNRRNAFILKKM